MAGAPHFSNMDFKSRFWQVKMVLKYQHYTAFTVGNLGFYKFTHPLWALQCAGNFSAPYAEYLERVELDLLCHLFG